MNIKFLATFIVIATFCAILKSDHTFAQSNDRFVKIIDSETKKPIANAITTFHMIGKRSKKSYQSEYSNNKGEVLIPFEGLIQIYVQQFEYKSYIDTITSYQNTVIELTKLSFELDEVVVSTSQYEDNTQRESIQEIRVIGRDQIESQQAVNLSEVLNNQLNINIDQDPVLGSRLNVQGIDGQNIKILVDGVPVVGRQNGNIDLSQFTLNNVERIEIIEGPMAVDYGADALGGVVNIITKSDFPYRIQSEVNTRYESVGHYNVDATINYQHGKSKLSFSGGRYFFDGYSSVDTSRSQVWKPREQLFANVKYTYVNEGTELVFKSDHLRQTTYFRSDPVITPYEAYSFDDEFIVSRINNALFLNQRFENNSSLNIIAGHSYYQRDKDGYRKDLTTLTTNALNSESAHTSNSVRDLLLRGTFSTNFPLSRFNQQIGFDAHHEQGEGDRINDGKQIIGDYAIFTSFEYNPINALTIRPGVRAAYNTKYGSPFMPSLNIKYDLQENITFRTSIARGFRAPSIKELELNFVDVNHNIIGNPSLDAELSNNLSLSAHYYKSINKDKDIHIEAKSFYNKIDNLISLALVDANTQLYSYVNLNQAETMGYSVNVYYRHKRLKISTGAGTTGVDNGLNVETRKQSFYYSPEYRGSLTYTIDKWKTDIAAYAKHYGVQKGLIRNENGVVTESSIESYSMFDLIASKSIMKNKITFVAGIKNIFDVTDINGNAISGNIHGASGSSNVVAMGRNYVFAMRFNLYSDAAKK
ncbi:MAG: TonB-dependent receptor [Bacteroidia bacterium]|nr:TonB-dependent receptor [Bacteroidia bacterium]